MNNKFQTPIVVFILIGLFTSCNDQNKYDNLSASDVPLQLMSGIKARATINNNWDNGNSIGIMMFHSKTNEPALQKGNYHYIAAKDGSESSFAPANAENTAYFPTGGAEVDVMGYSPYQSSIGKDLSVVLNTADQSDLNSLDFLTSERACEHSSNKPAVALEFVHRLARLDITLDVWDAEMEEDIKDASLVISGTNTQATWSLTENSFASKGEPGDISIPIRKGKNATAIIVPTTAENQITFTLTTARNTYTANYTKEFEEGTVNALHLQVKEHSVTITASIKPWEEGSGSGEAGLESAITGLSITGAEWNAGNSIGVMIFDNATNEPVFQKSNYHYVASEDAEGISFNPVDAENTAYFPTGEAKVDIMGYYPYTSSVDENLTVSLQTADQSDWAALDFLSSERAYGCSSNSSGIELNFVHRLAKLAITIDAQNAEAAGELKEASLVVSGTHVSAVWSLAENKFESKGETGDITIPIINGGKATAILIPTTEKQLKFTLKTASNTYTATYDKGFESGTVNTLHLHLKENKVSITSNIKPWEEGKGSGDTDLDNIASGLSLAGIKTNGVLMLGTEEGTTAIHTNYDYNHSTGELTPAKGEVPIYWDMLQGIPHSFQATFVPAGEAPAGQEKDILWGTSASVPFGNSIELEMKHAMAQLVLELGSDGSITSDELKAATVTFYVPQYVTEISWNQLSTSTNNARTILPGTSATDGLTRIATVYPQTWKADALVMSLKLGDNADGKVYTLYAKDIVSGIAATGNDFTLKAGEIYTLSARLSKTEIGIQVTVDDNWKEVSGTGTFN